MEAERIAAASESLKNCAVPWFVALGGLELLLLSLFLDSSDRVLEQEGWFDKFHPPPPRLGSTGTVSDEVRRVAP
jgi:hypothetical protein